MGIIAGQSFKGSVYTYVGAALGFVNTALLMPKLFSTAQVGLVNILVAVAIIFSQIGTLGFPNVLTRVFPHFRDNEKAHNGMLSLGMLVSIAGFLLALLLFFLSENYIIRSNAEKSPLLTENLFYIPVLIFFTLFFNILDQYNKALFDATTGTLLRELVGRVFISIAIALFWADLLNFDAFVTAYVAAYSLPALIIAFVLLFRKQLLFSPLNKKMLREHKREIFRVALFGIIAGFSGTAVISIDKYMINHYLGLDAAGIYSVCFYFGTLILMPARAIRKISSIVIAESWKRNDTDEIGKIYSKSTITQMVIGLYLFMGVWLNIDNIFSIIPDYSSGRYVIFFIGLAYVLEMSAGLSGMIMLNSGYYAFFSYLTLFNVLLIVINNMIFIPIFQITGGAIASAITILLFAVFRFIFLKLKFGLNPYNYKHLIVLAVSLVSFAAVYFLPASDNAIIDIGIKGSVLSILFGMLIFFTKVSEDINNAVLMLLKKIIRK